MDSELKSPPSCRYSVTVRRNPHRRARPTPSSAVPLSLPPPSSTKTIPSFPIDDILSIDVNQPPQNPNSIPPIPSPLPLLEDSISKNLKVFLRIRPLEINSVSAKNSKKGATRKNVWPQNPSEKTAPMAKPGKKSEISLTVKDAHSVTLCPPQSLQDQRRVKTEIYEGFSHVFAADSSQDEVYGRMVNPLVEDFLKGKSGMLAALGPSGSGKTHTVFGSIRDPGMVPLALRWIFSQDDSNGTKSSRTFYLSMFEIHSERGKGERVLDLSQDRGDVYLQQSMIKGLQEVVIFDAQQAESLIACGLSKRATAMTNLNSQSSRSQCIINIRSVVNYIDVECDPQSSSAILTIVDLAGAEREKRTGNQGARLLESNFINNTSMVFGLCLRSLLEHQKNPKKPLQKHFQNSLLTKYLRDYLEGKKQMTLILTVKSGGEDYSDASFLLRQASPFMNIKFDAVEELPSNSFGNKRQFQTFPKADQIKRIKITNGEASMGNKDKGGGTQFRKEEATPKLVKEHEPASTLVQSPSNINLEANDNKSLNKAVIEPVNRDREHRIMINFGKALWNVLKEYKRKLEVAEDEIHGLKESLAVEKERRSQLEDELNDLKSFGSCANEVLDEMSLVEVHESVNIAECQSTVIDEEVEPKVSLEERLAVEVERCYELEKELDGMKSCCSSGREVSVEVYPVEVAESIATELAEIEQCQSTSMDEACVQVSSLNLMESHRLDETDISDSTVGNSEVISLSALEYSEAQTCQKIGNGNVGCFEDFEDHKHKDRETTSSEVTGSMLQESAVKSLQPQVIVRNDSSTLIEGGKLQHEEEVNEKNSSLNFKGSEDTNGEQISNSMDNPTVSNVSEAEAKGKPFCQDVNPRNNQIVPSDNIPNPSEMCSVSSVSKSEVTLSPSPNLVNSGKPKRRLQPASSILLKNINALEFDDENEKPKVNEKISSLNFKDFEDTIGEKISNSMDNPTISNVSEAEAKGKLSCQDLNLGNIQIVPSDNITNPSEMGSVSSSVSRSEVSLPPSHNLVNPGKPKRRLQPASSILLKNINALEFDDENEKPKGRRKEKKASVVDVNKKTQGNIALLRLLTENLHL